MKKSLNGNRKKNDDPEPSAIIPIAESINDEENHHVVHHDYGHLYDIKHNNNNNNVNGIVKSNVSANDGRKTSPVDTVAEINTEFHTNTTEYAEDDLRNPDTSSIKSGRMDGRRKSDISSSGTSNSSKTKAGTAIGAGGSKDLSASNTSIPMIGSDEIELKQLNHKSNNRVRCHFLQ